MKFFFYSRDSVQKTTDMVNQIITFLGIIKPNSRSVVEEFLHHDTHCFITKVSKS